jgi:hypothetical protein
MTDTKQRTAGQAPSNLVTYNPIAETDFPPGTPVQPSSSVDGMVGKAKGIPGSANATGLAAGAGVEGESVLVQFGQVLELTTAQWDVVAPDDTGGLVRGSAYFLRAGFGSGLLTRTAPTGGGTSVAPIGIALSSTEMLVRIDRPIDN